MGVIELRFPGMVAVGFDEAIVIAEDDPLPGRVEGKASGKIQVRIADFIFYPHPFGSALGGKQLSFQLIPGHFAAQPPAGMPIPVPKKLAILLN